MQIYVSVMERTVRWLTASCVRTMRPNIAMTNRCLISTFSDKILVGQAELVK
jgi:hypothetical protein